MTEARERGGKTAPALRLRVSAAAQRKIRAGHPWVYAESVTQANREGVTGELAIVFDRQDKFLAIGLYDAASPLRVRLLHSGRPQPIDHAWWAENLKQAINKRAPVADALTNGYRCINGESDHWPGLVLDRYGDTLVLKLYTTAWLPRLSEVLGLFCEQLRLQRIVLRLSRNIQEQATEERAVRDGQVVRGPSLDGPVIFLETGLQFEAEVSKGQKTGFFLDQRDNRRQIEKLAAGRDVLNAFSFSGGFSLYAARGGARSVTDLDISAHALVSAQRNFRLNQNLATVSACLHRSVQADAFKWLSAKEQEQFDLIVLDPPSLAKRESERAGALQAYRRLVRSATQHLRPAGRLLACSCSAHVRADEFFAAVQAEVRTTGRKFRELGTSFHASDHPASFPEAEYLKGVYLEFE